MSYKPIGLAFIGSSSNNTHLTTVAIVLRDVWFESCIYRLVKECASGAELISFCGLDTDQAVMFPFVCLI